MYNNKSWLLMKREKYQQQKPYTRTFGENIG
jgi:hypothetical protein